jgi:hypothetical protein
MGEDIPFVYDRIMEKISILLSILLMFRLLKLGLA